MATSVAQEAPVLSITNLTIDGTTKSFEFNLIPGAEEYRVQSTTLIGRPFRPDVGGTLDGNKFSVQTLSPSRYWKMEATQMSSNKLLTANLLNRIAYGPTPDDLERLAAIGPQAYIDEQMQPETIPNPEATSTTVITNAANPNGNPDWVSVTVTGRVSSSTVYMFMRGVGDMYLDDVQLRLLNTINVTNIVDDEEVVTQQDVVGPNVLTNGDFESALSSGWNVSANLAGSSVTTDESFSGNSSLHMVSSQAGTTRSSSIYQDITPELPTSGGQRCVLSFSYLPNQYSHLLTIRLSGSGTIISGGRPAPTPEWIYATATGQATSGPRIYLYLSGRGEAFIDDIKLVEGTEAEVGANLLQNGNFESALSGPWNPTDNFTSSFIDNTVAYEGNSSLHIVASSGGSGGGNSIFQTIPVTAGETYTVSYWYLPDKGERTVTVRLSGSQLVSRPDNTPAGVERRLANRQAELEDLRAWHVQNAVGSRQQLQEVLLQFLENHFVTQHEKSYDYLDRYYNDDQRDIIATEWEYREIRKWRELLQQPDCTFLELLTVSAESPAMIVYLDTVDSRADGNNIANENYTRELLELFCNGVDNGYDQNDIVAMSRAWAGWRVDIVDEENINNPFAPRSTTYGFYHGAGSNSRSNLVGVWTFVFNPDRHGANRAPIFSEWDPNSPGDDPVALGPKLVESRFGSPWAGRPYQLALPERFGTNAIQDGHQILRHLAQLPHTMEYISVKLCRLFIHDDFVHGVYDYTDPDRSPEADLIHKCMLAWFNQNPKGQIRPVLETIFNSDLFRTYGGTLQKVKTPFEFTASAVRALRADGGDGSFTSTTDGYGISGTSRTASSAPLTRMGRMMLFDRGDPDGYPEAGPPWISAGTLAERVRFVQSLLIDVGDSGKSDGGNSNVTDPVALLQSKLDPGDWNDDDAVSGFFLGLLYPGIGLGNLNQYQAAANDFLNTDEDGTTISLFSALSSGSSTYDERVRGMVAMLMTFPRFQEQ